MAYKDFINDFNKDIAGDILFLYGKEDYLINWAIDKIIEKNVPNEYSDVDVVHLDGETCSSSDIISLSGTFSMFSDKRVVLVRNFLPIYKKNTNNDDDSISINKDDNK